MNDLKAPRNPPDRPRGPTLAQLRIRLAYWRSQIGVRKHAVKNVRELERQIEAKSVVTCGNDGLK